MANINLSQQIKDAISTLGAGLVGITPAEAISDREQVILRSWLKNGLGAGMQYMHRNLEKRINPALLMEGARSVICIGMPYKNAKDGSSKHFASYSLHADYHDFLKAKLLEAVGRIEQFAGKFKYKICVDSVPLAERSLAQRAGLGFIGKNHILINERLGVKILLGEIITDLELEADAPAVNRCGNCEACLKACPTGALRTDGMFDANKCVSYLTIESKEHIPQTLKIKCGDSVFGCDRCINACPFEKNATESTNTDFAFRDDIAGLSKDDILAMSADDFERIFKNTAVYRSGLDKLQSNARD